MPFYLRGYGICNLIHAINCQSWVPAKASCESNFLEYLIPLNNISSKIKTVRLKISLQKPSHPYKAFSLNPEDIVAALYCIITCKKSLLLNFIRKKKSLLLNFITLEERKKKSWLLNFLTLYEKKSLLLNFITLRRKKKVLASKLCNFHSALIRNLIKLKGQGRR